MAGDGISLRCKLPDDAFRAAWDAIKLDPAVRQRLLAQALLILNVRQKLPFEQAPLHGLLLLVGPPGTGKTTLARGLAHQIARHLSGTKTSFIQIDPHALTGASLGSSQKAVAKLFEQTLPEAALGGVAIVLLDELETLAADRQRLSLEANPVDVHRATDAVLSGMDALILEVSADNSQVCHASLCAPQYLLPLMRSHGHLLDEKRRAKLEEVLIQYRGKAVAGYPSESWRVPFIPYRGVGLPAPPANLPMVRRSG